MLSGWPDAEVTKSSGAQMTISCLFKQILKTVHHAALKCKISEQAPRVTTSFPCDEAALLKTVKHHPTHLPFRSIIECGPGLCVPGDTTGTTQPCVQGDSSLLGGKWSVKPTHTSTMCSMC